ncbi:MAG: transposase [Sedimentisphaerales bacterium]|nr:transposase [Sedimentisphaerales bacterium]
MPRLKRIAKGNIVYHVLNRANGRLRIFRKQGDFMAFEQVIAEALERFDMRLCGYCIMGSHWHLVLWPRNDGDLSDFMKWLTVTHSHRWHQAHDTVGVGHLYQGRFKSFPVQTDAYYLNLMKYVESNPVRAGIVKHSAAWPWSSLAIRRGSDKLIALSDGPVKLPQRWKNMVDNIPDDKIGERIAECIKRGQPFGNSDWVMKTVRRLNLESTLKPRGRPRKGV